MFVCFHTKLNEIITKYVPTRIITLTGNNTRNNPLRLDEAGRERVRNKHKLWRQYSRSLDPEKHRKYCRERNYVRAFTRRKTNEIENNIAATVKENPKVFYRHANSKTKVKSGIDDLEMYDEDGKFDRLTVNDQEKAEALSEFFSSVFTTENDEEVPQLPKMTAKVLNEVDITEEVVLKKLNALKISKSPGPDGIHPRVLRELKDNLAKPLTAIFKHSLGSETVPQN